MIVFMRCVAEAVVEKGVRGLAEMVPGGGFAVDVAGAALEKYRERQRLDAALAEIRDLALASTEQIHQATSQVTDDVAAAAAPEDRKRLELYLSQIPAAVRQSLKRPDDPLGKSVPAAFSLRTPDDVLRLLPGRPPRFAVGDPLPGKAGWVLDRPLGVGGFGEVWLARHPKFASLQGAVKFCHDLQTRDRDLLHESGLIDRVMAAGNHPHVVPLKDVHLDGGSPWLMYEYVPGGDLSDLVRAWQGKPAAERLVQAVRALRMLAEAVGVFHVIEPDPIVHRDLKPANILWDKSTKRLRITDFGIGGVSAGRAIDAEAKGVSTRGGKMLSYLRGSHTPLYSSPQQRAGDDPDPRDDVHALGVIGYQLLTGHLGQGAGPDFADDLREAGATEELISLLGRCVAQKADRRPATAGDLASLLAALPEEKSAPNPASPSPPAAVKATRPSPAVPPRTAKSPPPQTPTETPDPAPVVEPRPGWLRRLVGGSGEKASPQPEPVVASPPTHNPTTDQLRAEIAALSRDATQKAAAVARNAATCGCLWTLSGHKEPITCVAIRPDRDEIASSSVDEFGGPSEVKVWSLRSGKETRSHKCSRTSDPVQSLAYTPYGYHNLTYGREKGGIEFFTEGGICTLKIDTGQRGVHALAFRPYGQALASAGAEGTVKVWDCGADQPLEISSNRAVHTLNCEKFVYAVRYSPDGRRLATASGDGLVRLWDAGDGKPLLALKGHADDVFTVAFSPDGRRLASGGMDHTIRVWDVETGNMLAASPRLGHYVDAVVFSGGGEYLFSGDRTGTITVWDSPSGEMLFELGSHDGAVSCLTISSCGTRLVSGSADKTLKVWDVAALAARPAPAGGSKRAPTARPT